MRAVKEWNELQSDRRCLNLNSCVYCMCLFSSSFFPWGREGYSSTVAIIVLMTFVTLSFVNMALTLTVTLCNTNTVTAAVTLLQVSDWTGATYQDKRYLGKM